MQRLKSCISIRLWYLINISASGLDQSSIFSAFSPPTLESYQLTASSNNTSQWHVEITTDLTKRLIQKLKSGKAAGIDKLTTSLLKAGIDDLAPPFTHLFAESISSGIVPREWKIASVVPIPKRKRPSIQDFRPISLLPLPSKILESYALLSIKKYLINLYGKDNLAFGQVHRLFSPI